MSSASLSARLNSEKPKVEQGGVMLSLFLAPWSNTVICRADEPRRVRKKIPENVTQEGKFHGTEH